MYCKDCGNELNDNAKFCSRCGSQVESAGGKPIKNTVAGGIYVGGVSLSRNVIMIMLMIVNLVGIFSPFYSMLEQDRKGKTYSFMGLKDYLRMGDHYRDETFNAVYTSVIIIMCINAALLVVSIIQLINGKNWSTTGYRKITKTLLFVSLINFVAIVVMAIEEVGFSHAYFAPGYKLGPNVWYFLVGGLILATLLAEIGVRNALKKQEQ